MPVYFLRANGERINLDDIYPRGCTISFLGGGITQLADFQEGDDHVFDAINTCLVCGGPMSDEGCITCGFNVQTNWMADVDEDTSALWPLPEWKPSYLGDSHGLDCDYPECSSLDLPNIEQPDMSDFIAPLTDHARTTSDIDLACHEAVPPT